MHHVILGAGPAGVIAAETLRKHDASAKVTILGAEDEAPYSRMAIPYLLSRKIDEQGTHLRHDEDHYKNQGIDVVRARAGAVDTKRKTIALQDGGDVEYDRLLIAAGASALRPQIEGLELPGVRNCWTLEDARAIMDRALKGDNVVLMGAGFIGSIILEALVSRGVKLTVVEMGDRMVPRMMDQTAGGLLKRWCEEKGVEILTGTQIEQIMRSKDRLDISLSSGKSITAKLVVVAAGVAPNIGFLEGSGINTREGVKVDGFLRTSAPDVYAAGDVAQARDHSTGKFSVLAIQPVAADHGRIAALNMAGRKTPHTGSLNMNVLDTIGLVSASFGAWDGVKGGTSAAMSDANTYRYLRLEFDGDRLAGAQSVGLTDHIGIARGLIETKLRLGRWKDVLMKSPQRLAEAYVAVAQGIS